MRSDCNIYSEKGPLLFLSRVVLFAITLLVFTIPIILFIQDSLLQLTCFSIALVLSFNICSRYIDKKPLNCYGFILTPSSLYQAIWGVFIGSLAVVLILITGALLGIYNVSITSVEINRTQLIYFALKMLFVAFAEESVYRGYLYTNLQDVLGFYISNERLRVSIAIFLSSLIFGLAHFGNSWASSLSVSFLVLNGIAFCIPFVLTKNLGLSIGLHFGWNFFQTFLGFNMSGNIPHNALFEVINTSSSKLLTGGNYGPEGGLIGLLGAVIMITLSAALVKSALGRL